MDRYTQSLAAVMLALGAYAAVIGAKQLPDINILAPKTVSYYLISAVAGLLLVVIAVLAMRGKTSKSLIALAAVAITLLAANQIVGLATSSILCFTPS
jgi:hypothetical protein